MAWTIYRDESDNVIVEKDGGFAATFFSMKDALEAIEEYDAAEDERCED